MKKIIYFTFCIAIVFNLTNCTEKKTEVRDQVTETSNSDTLTPKFIGKWHLTYKEKFEKNLANLEAHTLLKYKIEKECVFNFKKNGKGEIYGQEKNGEMKTNPLTWKLVYGNKFLEINIMNEITKIELVKVSEGGFEGLNKGYVEKFERVKQ